MSNNNNQNERHRNQPGSLGNAEYDGVVRELPYNEAQEILDDTMEILYSRASELLKEKYREKGDGWQFEEPRYHYWKGMDEQFSATHHTYNGNVHAGVDHTAHGLNHLLMALAIALGKLDTEDPAE